MYSGRLVFHAVIPRLLIFSGGFPFPAGKIRWPGAAARPGAWRERGTIVFHRCQGAVPYRLVTSKGFFLQFPILLWFALMKSF